MERTHQRCTGFLLRLPVSSREQAVVAAQTDGISLNHFVSLAVAEKLMRLEMDSRDPVLARVPLTVESYLRPVQPSA